MPVSSQGSCSSSVERAREQEQVIAGMYTGCHHTQLLPPNIHAGAVGEARAGRSPPPRPARQNGRSTPPANEDFLTFMLKSFGDPERLTRLQATFKKRDVDMGRFWNAWIICIQQTRALEVFNEKILMKCLKNVLFAWHRCARRGAIARIDFEIESLCLDRDINDSCEALAESSHGAPLSPREATTHELRMQSLLAALKKARVAERETAMRARKQEIENEGIVMELRGKMSELKTQLKQTEDKLRQTTHELTSQTDTIGSLCTMYLYKQEEVLVSPNPLCPPCLYIDCTKHVHTPKATHASRALCACE